MEVSTEIATTDQAREMLLAAWKPARTRRELFGATNAELRAMPLVELEARILEIRRIAANTHLSEREWGRLDRMRVMARKRDQS